MKIEKYIPGFFVFRKMYRTTNTRPTDDKMKIYLRVRRKDKLSRIDLWLITRASSFTKQDTRKEVDMT